MTILWSMENKEENPNCSLQLHDARCFRRWHLKEILFVSSIRFFKKNRVVKNLETFLECVIWENTLFPTNNNRILPIALDYDIFIIA